MNDVIRIDRANDDENRGLSETAPLLPLPSQEQLGVRVRDARVEDLAFIDALQKKHSKAVGWMPTGQLEGHLKKGHVLIAEAIQGVGSWESGVGQGSGGACGLRREGQGHCELPHSATGPLDPLATSRALPVGYCIGVDKYFKREDAGIIYQMNIEPGHQRGLLGATLLQAMFDRWPYGVRLCCCWCAQDLPANRFWEAMGFVPLAFRSGSKKRDRVHIFWQKQIRRGEQVVGDGCWVSGDGGQGIDSHATTTSGGGGHSGGWWFPSQTGGGAIREDRIVLPIPPGTHWSDAKPRLFPEVSGLIESAQADRKALEAPAREAARARQREEEAAAKARAQEAAARSETVAAGGLRFGGNEGRGAEGSGAKGSGDGSATKSKTTASKSAPRKNDPRLVAAARELRDRWLEHAAAHPGLIEAGNTAERRYDVGRSIDSAGLSSKALPQRKRAAG